MVAIKAPASAHPMPIPAAAPGLIELESRRWPVGIVPFRFDDPFSVGAGLLLGLRALPVAAFPDELIVSGEADDVNDDVVASGLGGTPGAKDSWVLAGVAVT